MAKITRQTVKDLVPPRDKQAFIWDDLKGFGIRIMPSGIATYIVQVRTLDGTNRRLKIGRTNEMTPDEARDRAMKMLAEARAGGDPAIERQERRKALKVSELCDLYLADAEGRVKASTLEMDASRIRSHVKPLIGHRTITSLTAEDITRLQTDIIAGKTAASRKGRGGITTGGKGVAARTVGMMGAILEFARRKRLVTENVARGIAKAPEGKQRRFLSYREIVRLGAALDGPEGDADNRVAKAAVKFLLLTGCRRMEALGLRPEWLDRDLQSIRFPDTKTGAQSRAVGKAAWEALDAIAPPDGWSAASWCFPASRGDGHFVGLPKYLDQVCERAKLEGVTVHVLRHSFASMAVELDYSELIIAGLLGHATRGVTSRYSHVADKKLRAAADRVSARIAAALAGVPEDAAP